MTATCGKCRGTGKVQFSQPQSSHYPNRRVVVKVCHECKGTGRRRG